MSINLNSESESHTHETRDTNLSLGNGFTCPKEVNPFPANVPFLYPWFSDVLRGYRNGTLAENS